LSELVASDAADMMSNSEAAEAGGAHCGMDTTVHIEERMGALGRSYADGNILDKTAAVSYLAALVSTAHRVVCGGQAWVSGHMAACLMGGGSFWRLNGRPRLVHEGGGICDCYERVAVRAVSF
jgi:hypothetical protein